ncbi:NAD(P)/FAD-dependent oxidoreductase [Halococcus sp. IIIV-5B]|uniref:NAD(P)/FAD-dependent oxidoreductase n=1 Tax=Halococcus sp. IIIV-5B TaxID=2321230 RepID=UPI000E74FAC5|nr:FAD-dependent oxidoreductase [Halococcus sp. IIIV-5B]RJS99492.1 NAD(P)/FAD-dependent oxidoreductase [Halococcus sp. IIIV-5B]
MTDLDVVVVGGGPTGCSAGVFTARYGLRTTIFDRGAAALPRCAYLENYPGFPAGIDVETFSRLLHAQAEEAGCSVVPEMVESVERDGDGFAVETSEGRQITATYVVAATWYDGSFLRPLGGDEMFETHDHGGETHEHFDPDYADDDGRTPVDGLYVAAPAGERTVQAVIAAGNGAHVARSLLFDHRCAEGYPEGVAAHYDWLRGDADFTGEWAERDRWREWFASEVEVDPADDDRVRERREQYIDDAFETYVPPEEAEQRAERGVRRLVDVVGPERVLDALDDDAIREYLDGN